MTKQNQEKLDKPREQITDVELSKLLSDDVYKNYCEALDFIETSPKHSLIEFRKVVECVIEVIANKYDDINLESKILADNIENLFECRVLSKPLYDNLLKVKKFGNKVAHKRVSFNKENSNSNDKYSNFNKENSNYNEKYYNFNKENSNSNDKYSNFKKEALDIRETVISIFEDVHKMIHGSYPPPIEYVTLGHNREIMYTALTSTDYKEKLKAGIICESILEEQFNSSAGLASNNVKYNFEELVNITLAFYEVAYKISAQVDETDLKIAEERVFEECELEPLYRYAKLGFAVNKDKKFKNAFRVAADRGYTSAIVSFGVILYKEKKFKKALEYLLIAKSDGSALLHIFRYYIEGNACTPNFKKALSYLERAVDFGYPDALATLGLIHHLGKHLPKDDKKSQELLEESIALGSDLGEKFKERLKETKSAPKQKTIVRDDEKIGRNEKCPCGSGKKYKKCCGSPNKKIQ
jgi:hypothetical protein